MLVRRLAGVVAPALLTALSTTLLAARAPAQQQREPYVADPDHAQKPHDAPLEDPGHALEFTIGGDGIAASYRTGFRRGRGYTTFGAFVSQDDDVELQARLMRFGEPLSKTPLAFGIGLGGFAAYVDDTNADVGAITVTGAVEYTLQLDYPIRIGFEASYAPAVATFVDGDRVLDLVGRVEADLSAWAAAFAGYRHLEVDVSDDDDAELDSAFELGVRLGF